MITFDAVDFNELRCEEVLSFFWRIYKSYKFFCLIDKFNTTVSVAFYCIYTCKYPKMECIYKRSLISMMSVSKFVVEILKIRCVFRLDYAESTHMYKTSYDLPSADFHHPQQKLW